MKIKSLLIYLVFLLSCDSSSDFSFGGNFSGDVQMSGESSGTGIGGSMARFTIRDDYLYTWGLYLLKKGVCLPPSSFDKTYTSSKIWDWYSNIYLDNLNKK